MKIEVKLSIGTKGISMKERDEKQEMVATQRHVQHPI